MSGRYFSDSPAQFSLQAERSGRRPKPPTVRVEARGSGGWRWITPNAVVPGHSRPRRPAAGGGWRPRRLPRGFHHHRTKPSSAVVPPAVPKLRVDCDGRAPIDAPRSSAGERSLHTQRVEACGDEMRRRQAAELLGESGEADWAREASCVFVRWRQ